MASNTGRNTSHVDTGPPGMMLGPLRAPSSPPDTPAPTNRNPLDESQASRRSVSVYRLLPQSTTMSPASSRGISASITASTGAPACTITRMRRGEVKLSTKACKVSVARMRLPTCCATKACVVVVVRLNTLTANPRLSMLSTRFWPITARPIRPMSLLPFMLVSLEGEWAARQCAEASDGDDSSPRDR